MDAVQAMTKPLLNHKLEGSGPNLVLLHPVGLDLTFWDEVVAALAPRYRILRVDLRGHGESSAAAPGSTLADYAEDVHALLSHLKFAPAAVLGLSFGGMITQELALAHAEDVSALVICGCPCTLPDAGRQMMAERAASAERDGMGPAIETTLERWFTKPFRDSGADKTTRARLLADDPNEWARGWRAISHLDTAPRLGEIKVPTLCIAGELDSAAPPAALGEIAKRIEGAQLAILPGAPHMMQIERPREFADTVGAFLDAVLHNARR
jgi:3-oxoadipate enol-lactonase